MSESNLEDRAAINDLFTRYCCALDNGEIEAVVDCFTVDAILKSPVIDISGRDEIRAFAGRFAAQRAATRPPHPRQADPPNCRSAEPRGGCLCPFAEMAPIEPVPSGEGAERGWSPGSCCQSSLPSAPSNGA
jgi:hypothetical protein